MPTLVVPANVRVCQVEVPEKIKGADGKPRSVERSPGPKKDAAGNALPQEGAIYIRPASTLQLTDDEWVCVQASQPDLAKRLIEVKPKPGPRPKAAPKKRLVEPKPKPS